MRDGSGPHPGPASGRGTHRRTIVAVAAAAGVVFLVTGHLAWLDEPFDQSLGHQISAGYLGYAMRAFDAHGFFGLGMQWSHFFHPATTAVHIPYLNHPWLPLAMYRPFWLGLGRDESALRTCSLLLVLGTAATLVLVVRRNGGAFVAGLALLFFCTTPAVVEYGNLTCPPLFALPWLGLATLAFCTGDREPGRWRGLVYGAAAFVAALSDWNAYGLVPGLWLWIALLPQRPARPWRLAFLVGLPFGVGALTYLAWCGWTLGGVGALGIHLANVQGMLGAYERGLQTLLATTGTYFRRLYEWPGLVLAGLGLVATVVRFRGRQTAALDRLTLVSVLSGAVPCLVFWSRTGTHEFWILLLAPAMAMLAASGLVTAGRAANVLPARAPVLLAGAALLVAAWGGWHGVRLHDEYRTTVWRDRGAALDGLVERGFLAADDVVLFPDYDSSFATRFYTRVPVIPKVGHPEVFDLAMKFLYPGRDRIGNLWFALPASVFAQNAWVKDLPLRLERSDPAAPFGDQSMAIAQVDKAQSMARRRH